jgi:hypothetical protein
VAGVYAKAGKEVLMTIVKLDLDNKTFESIKRIAIRRRATVETLIQDLVQRLVAIENTHDPLLGMFAQEPDLMDAVTTSAMGARETDPLRLPVG